MANPGQAPRNPIATFETAARFFADLVAAIPPTAWDGPGLGEWDLRSLVGHTSRSLTTVITYLPRPAAVIDVPSTAAYFDWTVRQIGADPADVAERGRQAGIALGDDPAAAIEGLLDDAMTALLGVSGDLIIETIAGGMRLSDYLPTRTFELVVHGLDIAAATGQAASPPALALRDAVQLAAELALLQGDGATLLLAVTGRRPLPENFSVL
jgi:uncharacterized protein (TIGR03083 family)